MTAEISTTLPLLLVVPDAHDGEAARRLLRLATWLSGRDDVDLTVLLWLTGDLAPAFASVGRTVDVGREHDRWLPRVLRRVGAGRLAGGLKDRRIAKALAALPTPTALYLGGTGALGVLDWLDRPPAVVLQMDGTEIAAGADGTRDLLADADPSLVVVTDLEAERWLVDEADWAPEAVSRLALLDGPDRPSGPVRSDTDLVVGLWGATPDDLVSMVSRVGASAAAGRGSPPRYVWFGSEQLLWPLWQGPEAVRLTGRVRVVAADRLVQDLDTLDVLAVGGAGILPDGLRQRALLTRTVLVEVGPDGVDEAVDASMGRLAPRDAAGPTWALTAADGGPGLLDAIRGLARR